VNQIIELGLRVIMVTGDYSLTSIQLAIESGIFSSKNYDTLVKFRQQKSKSIVTEFSYTRRILLNGAEIESLSKEEFDLIYSEYYQMIICRATPNHKFQLVKLLQANSRSVLMVGDGLNDVSALKQADQSVAMNCGSKLAEETANIVLLNNSFGSIYDLLFMGRRYTLNCQRAFIFTMVGIFIQYATSFPSSVLGLPQLHSNLQMIVFSTLIDFLPTLSLIYEKPDFKSIKSAGKKKILNFRIIMFSFFLGLLTVIFAYIVYFFYLIKYAGISLSSLIFSSFGDPSVYSNPDFTVAQSIGFYTIVIIHVFGNLYTVRTMHKSTFEAVPFFGTYSNLFLVFCSLLVAVLMILIVTFPIPRLTVNIMQLFYAIPLVESLMVILIVEGLKFIIFRKKVHPFNG
jgi:Ca2+-transporting ATPase